MISGSALPRRVAAASVASLVMRMVLSSAAAVLGTPATCARWRSWWRVSSTSASSWRSARAPRRRVHGGNLAASAA
ncbi:MAG TPA: hypothetical protein VGC13_22500 [Longimicrobium sp.]